jgi:hypothetical protein
MDRTRVFRMAVNLAELKVAKMGILWDEKLDLMVEK